MTDNDLFAEWCIVELMGHRRVAARVTEQTVAGHGFLRLDEPDTPGNPGRTQLVSPSSVYALHPTTEQVVRAMASQWRSAPIQRWELEAAREESDVDGDAEMLAAADVRYDEDGDPF